MSVREMKFRTPNESKIREGLRGSVRTHMLSLSKKKKTVVKININEKRIRIVT